MMKNKKVMISLAVFFALMLVVTIVSENIYYDNLTVVNTGVAKADLLSENYFNTASIVYGTKTESIYSKFHFETVTLLSENGKTVAAETPLYQVDPKAILMAQKQLELSVLTLKEQNNSIGTGTASAKLQYEINEMRIKEEDEKVEVLKAMYANDGIVNADKAGIVNYRIDADDPIGKGQAIASVTSDTGEYFLKWQMSAASGNLFAIEDMASSTLSVYESKGSVEEMEVVQRTIDLPITEISYQSDSGSYLFTAKIPEGTRLAMGDGAKIDVSCQYTSQQTYPYIVPMSAITFEKSGGESDSRGYVYSVMSREKVYGTEYYVVPYYIEIQRMVDNSAALTNLPSGLEIVFQTSKPLTKDMAVRIEMEMK